MFVRNAWYVAAWDHEVTRELKRRILLDEPVLLFRKDDGTPVALEDRCCHRQAPLSMGKLIGNIVNARYHGLRIRHDRQVREGPEPGHGSRRAPGSAPTRWSKATTGSGSGWATRPKPTRR